MVGKRDPSDKRARRSLFAGVVARGRWLVAGASLKFRPPRPLGAATVEGLRRKDVALDVLVGRLHAVIVDEERRLGSVGAAGAPGAEDSGAEDSGAEDSWRGAVAQMNLEIAALVAAPERPKRYWRGGRDLSAKLEATATAMREVVSDLRAHRAALELAVAEWETLAEEAVTRGDDAAAIAALESARWERQAIAGLELELVAREAMLAEWVGLSEKVCGGGG